MDTKIIENSFEYLCEENKIAYQACINSLLELAAHLNDKRTKAIEGGYEKALMPTQELKVLNDWAVSLAGKLMGHFDTIDRLNRNAMKLERCHNKIREMKTPSLKDLTKVA